MWAAPGLIVAGLNAATAEIGQFGGRWLEPGQTRELNASGGA